MTTIYDEYDALLEEPFDTDIDWAAIDSLTQTTVPTSVVENFSFIIDDESVYFVLGFKKKFLNDPRVVVR